MPGTLKSRSKSESHLRNGTPYSKVIHTCTVCVLAQNQRTDDTPIEHRELSRILRSHTGKRRTHRAKITCYEDRMEFKRRNCVSRGPFRDQLYYRDIIVPYRCIEYPNIFMISLRGNDSRLVLYETYKCKSLADADKLGNIVLTATGSADKIFHEGELSIPHRAQSFPQVSEPDRQSLDRETPIRSRPSSSERSWSSQRDVKRYSVSPSLSLSKSPVRQISPMQIKPNDVEKVQMVRMTQSEPEINNTGGTTTYFEYDQFQGASFNEKGPIFMFLERFPTAQY